MDDRRGRRADSDINAFSVQPFINYNLADGWAIVTAPIITANWSAPSDDQWTVPLGIGFSKVTTLGHQPLSIGIQFYRNATCPAPSGSTQVKFIVSFLYPKGPAS